MSEKTKSEGTKTRAPQELKPEELQKVAGGLGGDDIGVPGSKGFHADGDLWIKGGAKGYQTSGSAGD